MAINDSRSLNAELGEGMTDGAWKKLDMDRSGVVEPETAIARSQLASDLYDIQEAPFKVTPDGRSIR